MQLFTIGFTKKSAEEFFTALSKAGVKRVIDIRLNNVSQLAGFSKKEDLQYFLKSICGIEYTHLPLLAPTQEMLEAYRKQKGDWAGYEKRFIKLIASRKVESRLDKSLFANGCLLCSEDKPDHCHRRLVAEYLQAKWATIEIIHLE